jgi:hypothetical protein
MIYTMSKIKDVVIDQMNLDREIEEAVRKHCGKGDGSYGPLFCAMGDSFIAGANWMKGKMYSESEVISLLQKYRYDLSTALTPWVGDTTPNWFTQKKKL